MATMANRRASARSEIQFLLNKAESQRFLYQEQADAWAAEIAAYQVALDALDAQPDEET